jgi:hypothetical protein
VGVIDESRVYADFQNADEEGRLRLNCVGTLADLSQQEIELAVGRSLIFYSEDLEVAGVVEYSEVGHLWVGRIDWDSIMSFQHPAPFSRCMY